MSLRILVVDDNSFSLKMIKDWVKEVLKCTDVYFCTPCSYNVGLESINTEYDIALFDYDLGEKSADGIENTGYDLYLRYAAKPSRPTAYLYSADSYKVNRMPNVKTTCLDDKEVQDILKYHITHNTPKDSTPMAPQAMTMSIPQWNEKHCDERHDKIEILQEKYEERNEMDHKALRDVLKEMSAKLDTSNAQGRQTFWAMIVFGVGVMGTFATMIIKIPH